MFASPFFAFHWQWQCLVISATGSLVEWHDSARGPGFCPRNRPHPLYLCWVRRERILGGRNRVTAGRLQSPALGLAHRKRQTHTAHTHVSLVNNATFSLPLRKSVQDLNRRLLLLIVESGLTVAVAPVSVAKEEPGPPCGCRVWWSTPASPQPPQGGEGRLPAVTPAAQVEADPPPPATRWVVPTPFPPQQRARQVGGKRAGQPQHPCRPCVISRRPQHACKSCKGHRRVRHCCSRHHEGHPRVTGVDQQCLHVHGGTRAVVGRSALRRVNARAGSLVQGRGG